MANEKFTLTWHSYASHFQEVLSNLFETGESSDVTLVCNDQVKFKAHKFVLKSCSPVFESILDDTNESKSVVYLRGVNQLELKPILDFIYYGQASFYQEKMKEFLNIGKDLQIIEIKEVPEEEELVDNGENIAEKNHHDVISKEVLSDDNEIVDENESASSTASQPISTQQSSLKTHIESVHVGMKYPCNQCNYKATTQSSLKTHILSVHDCVKYPCHQCEYKATQQSHLKRHIDSVHEGVKYPCNQSDYKATQQSNLKTHMKSKHNYKSKSNLL